MSDKGPLRLRLVLGKYRVIKVDRTALAVAFVLDLTNSIKITLEVPPYVDIVEGDLLTLYTETLTNANPQQSPVQ